MNKNEILLCQINTHAAALTIGKPYEVLDEEDNKVIVIDDNGKRSKFYRSRFSKKSILTVNEA